MRIELVYDLDMYKWLLKPIHDKLEERGHQVFVSKTRSDPRKPKCDGSIAIQDVAYSNGSSPSRPRFFMNHGSSATKAWSLNMPIDYFISPSPYWTQKAGEKRALRDHQYKIIGDFGYPRMDSLLLAQTRKDFTRQLLYEMFNVPKDQPLVVCFPTYKKPNMEQRWVREFHYAELVEKIKQHYALLICPHQMDTTTEFDNLLEKWQIYRAYDWNRLLLFAAADVIISDTSGAAYEACGLDTPVVLIGGVQKLESTYGHVDLGPHANLNNIKELVDSQLHNPKEYQDRRRFWADYILGPCDGLASERVVDALEGICTLAL